MCALFGSEEAPLFVLKRHGAGEVAGIWRGRASAPATCIARVIIAE